MLRSHQIGIHRGFTLIEMLVATVIVSMILMAVARVVSHSDQARRATRAQVALEARAQFALERMVDTLRRADALVLPEPDDISTVTHPQNATVAWLENVREQWVPAATGREFESAVLAVVIGEGFDLDDDGIDDADNDQDGRINEDPGADLNDDGQPGIAGIDDDGDGTVDEGTAGDDDEDADNGGGTDEDARDIVDADDDAVADEDPAADWNGDGQSGISGVDDDGDAQTDESVAGDDDEDADDGGATDEDWLDTVVYFISNDDLIERWPTVGAASGQVYGERILTEDISYLRFERLHQAGADHILVAITLELSDADGRTVSLSRAVTVGAHP